MVASIRKKSGKDEHMSNRETVSIRVKDKALIDNSDVIAKNISFGVNLYKNALSKEDCLKYVNLLNDNLDGSGKYSWLPSDTDESVRISANDFLVSKEYIGPENEINMPLYKMNSNVLKAIKTCVSDYANSWDMSITYYDPLNFVRYVSPTGYFAPHHDDSPSTVRTITAVMYLNDDYEGGRLVFPRLDNVTVKPEAGDLIVFPASYLYEHESTLVSSGTKYCVVSFSDYIKRG
jgi:Rps23 Pro-64 3,4-dihydroxylase Tpa1-like proline 4-hydroxylase